MGKKKERERETGKPGEILTMQLRLLRVSGSGRTADGGPRTAAGPDCTDGGGQRERDSLLRRA